MKRNKTSPLSRAFLAVMGNEKRQAVTIPLFAVFLLSLIHI